MAESTVNRKAQGELQVHWRKIQSNPAFQSVWQSIEELRLAFKDLNSPEGRDRAKKDLQYLLSALKNQSTLTAEMFWVWCQKSYWRLRIKAAPLLHRAPAVKEQPQAEPVKPAPTPRDPLEAWNKAKEFRPEAFLPVLLQAYLKVLAPVADRPLSSSPVVPLADLYAVIAPTPEQSLKYLREEFTRDIYLLHRSGHNTTRTGIQVSFPISRGVKGKNLTINDENGTQLRYYGVRFSRPQPVVVSHASGQESDLPTSTLKESRAVASANRGGQSASEHQLLESSAD